MRYFYFCLFFFFFNDTATTEIYTLSYTTLFRSLVHEAGRQLTDGREPLALGHLVLGVLELVELAPRLRVQARVVERERELVGGRLDQRHLCVGEGRRRGAPERQRDDDAAARLQRHAHEAARAFVLHDRPRGRPEVRRGRHVRHARRLAGGGHAADQAFADGQHGVDRAHPRRQPALAAQVQRLAIGREQVQARHFVTGHVGEGVQRQPQRLLEIERAVEGLRDGAQHARVRLDHRRRLEVAAHERAELLLLPVGEVDEVEGVAVHVGAYEDRDDLEGALSLADRQRDLRDGGGRHRAVRAHLHAGLAQIHGRRVPAVAAVLGHAHRQRHARARGDTALGDPRGG